MGCDWIREEVEAREVPSDSYTYRHENLIRAQNETNRLLAVIANLIGELIDSQRTEN